jgi:hypothetical protein
VPVRCGPTRSGPASTRHSQQMPAEQLKEIAAPIVTYAVLERATATRGTAG